MLFPNAKRGPVVGHVSLWELGEEISLEEESQHLGDPSNHQAPSALVEDPAAKEVEPIPAPWKSVVTPTLSVVSV